MNNIVSEAPPPCKPIQQELLEVPGWLEKNAVLNSTNATVTLHNRDVMGIQQGDGLKGAQ